MKLKGFFTLLLLAGCGLMANALGQSGFQYPPQLGPRAFTLSGSSGSVVAFANLNGQSFCTVAVASSSTMGGGTVTVEVTNDNGASYYPVSGVQDLGNPSSPAPSQTITLAGTKIAVPVSGQTGIELVLSGATGAAITGSVACNAGSGVVLNRASAAPFTQATPTGGTCINVVTPPAAGSIAYSCASPTVAPCPTASTNIQNSGPNLPCSIGEIVTPGPQATLFATSTPCAGGNSASGVTVTFANCPTPYSTPTPVVLFVTTGNTSQPTVATASPTYTQFATTLSLTTGVSTGVNGKWLIQAHCRFAGVAGVANFISGSLSGGGAYTIEESSQVATGGVGPQFATAAFGNVLGTTNAWGGSTAATYAGTLGEMWGTILGSNSTTYTETPYISTNGDTSAVTVYGFCDMWGWPY